MPVIVEQINEYLFSATVQSRKTKSGRVQAPDNSVLTRAVMMTEANNKMNKISISYMSTMSS